MSERTAHVLRTAATWAAWKPPVEERDLPIYCLCPSLEQWAEAMKLTGKAVRKRIQKAVRLGFLIVEREGGGFDRRTGKGVSTIYKLNWAALEAVQPSRPREGGRHKAHSRPREGIEHAPPSRVRPDTPSRPRPDPLPSEAVPPPAGGSQTPSEQAFNKGEAATPPPPTPQPTTDASPASAPEQGGGGGEPAPPGGVSVQGQEGPEAAELFLRREGVRSAKYLAEVIREGWRCSDLERLRRFVPSEMRDAGAAWLTAIEANPLAQFRASPDYRTPAERRAAKEAERAREQAELDRAQAAKRLEFAEWIRSRGKGGAPGATPADRIEAEAAYLIEQSKLGASRIGLAESLDGHASPPDDPDREARYARYAEALRRADKRIADYRFRAADYIADLYAELNRVAGVAQPVQPERTGPSRADVLAEHDRRTRGDALGPAAPTTTPMTRAEGYIQKLEHASPADCMKLAGELDAKAQLPRSEESRSRGVRWAKAIRGHASRLARNPEGRAALLEVTRRMLLRIARIGQPALTARLAASDPSAAPTNPGTQPEQPAQAPAADGLGTAQAGAEAQPEPKGGESIERAKPPKAPAELVADAGAVGLAGQGATGPRGFGALGIGRQPRQTRPILTRAQTIQQLRALAGQ